ncbi:hypothetical protein [Agromyces mangrovi Wang et al. 2018]|uniref:hypothetical protein n=1 Tax=Agromyces mangrovi TaxID=1858653 RepID=UPI003D9B5E27
MRVPPRAELDAGDVLVERRTEVADGETAGELLARLARDDADLVVTAADAIAAGTAARPQEELRRSRRS